MTLSQRLTRAGLAFILFGTVAALVPTNGNASAATDGCTIPTQSYSVGTVAQDPTTIFTTTTSGTNKSVTLTQFLSDVTTNAGNTPSNSNPLFTTSISGSTITTSTLSTTSTGTTDSVTILFPGGRVVTYTVTAA